MPIFLDATFQTLFNTHGSTTLSLRTGFVILLAVSISLRSEFSYPSNFLNRALPLYQPYPYNLFYFFWWIPDNACQRVYWGLPQMTFDFIVVGAGPAGSVIASRLSENPYRKVLLIEAGGNPAVDSMVPQFFPFVINNTNIWKQNAEFEATSAQAMKNGCPMICGKQLGGSSETNAMLYVCPNDRDFNNWAAEGNIGWDYNSMLPLMKRSENNTDDRMNSVYHGRTGLLQVSTNTKTEPFAEQLEEGYRLLHYKNLSDYNVPTVGYNGFVRLQQTIGGGERCSAYRSFIVAAKARPNFYVMKNTLVTNVVFSGTRATGVVVKTNETYCSSFTIPVRKEVILSAGAFGSPKILMQSGIGKTADIPVGIAQIKNLPVGYNYRDHALAVHFITVNPNATAESTLEVTAQSMSYFYNRTAPFAQVGILASEAFIHTTDVNATYPEIQHVFYRYPKNQVYMSSILANFGFKDEYIAKVVAENANFEIIMTYTVLLQPKSAGTVKLRSFDPTASIKVNANFFSDPADVDTMVRGINRLQDLFNTAAIQTSSPSFIKMAIPACDSIAYPSDAYWKCYIKYVSHSLWHPTGTCKMGPVGNASAVVDPTLKVQGFVNIRVADASIMPYITSGNTQCPTYAIGQKAFDLINAANP